MKTRSIKKDELKIDWYIIDASGIRLGQLASAVARVLIGKDKVNQSPNFASGDQVVVINSDKISVHPSKKKGKIYYRHSGYIGSLKEETLESLLERDSRKVIERAVKGMLPNNKLRDKFMKRLYVYKDENHEHEAQKPVKMLNNSK